MICRLITGGAKNKLTGYLQEHFRSRNLLDFQLLLCRNSFVPVNHLDSA